MVIVSCLGFSGKKRVCALKIFKEKWLTAEVDVKNKSIFCRSSHRDVLWKKGALKY